MLSVWLKLRFLNGGYDTCQVKEQSMPVRTGVHMPSLTGYVGEKLYIDLVSMAEDNFSRCCRAYPILNKEARTVAKILVDQHFNIYGLPDQLHSDNRREFVNKLWKELFSEFKIQHTTTLPYNLS